MESADPTRCRTIPYRNGCCIRYRGIGRTQEKLNGANNGGAQTSTPAPTFSPAPAAPISTGFVSSPTTGAGSFTAPATGFSASSFASAPKPATAVSSSGKSMPAQPEQPEI